MPVALDWTRASGDELLVASLPWRGRALPLWAYACQGKWQGLDRKPSRRSSSGRSGKQHTQKACYDPKSGEASASCIVAPLKLQSQA
jgi:hypothetical protein